MPDDKVTPALLAHIESSVEIALTEDIGSGDLTAALIPAGRRAHAEVISRQPAVICGEPWVNEVFRQLDDSISIQWRVTEGGTVVADQVLCELRGPARAILTGERTALNFLQLLSGTATVTRQYVDIVSGTGVTLLDTRKTVPGLRLAQKYAVRCGGASNHRLGLFDAILIKENHIACAGGIEPAVRMAREQGSGAVIEVEVETLLQVDRALAAGADRLLLDNFSPADLVAAVALRDRAAPGIALEASGGVTRTNLKQVADTGVDFVSIGSLTKDLEAVDLSMRFRFADQDAAG
jgi:nicotinate-nucleotide pyrophosphorylase (carboxylating)